MRNKARLAREESEQLDKVIEGIVRREVQHQIAGANLTFSVDTPLWYMKSDISRAFQAVEDVYRNHGNRRTPKNRPDRYPKGDPRKVAP